MLTNLIGTKLDQRTQSLHQKPAYQILLFSRWLDTDSDIVRGTYTQTPMDVTEQVQSVSLNLDMETDASSASITFAINKLPLGIFYNCIIQIREGDEFVDIANWPTTFTGWRIGQPGSTETLKPFAATPAQGQGPRGEIRNVTVTFVSRERQFADFEITSDGVWLPNNKSNPAPNSPRNNYDDVGLIAKEICTDPNWGMGLQPDEVQIGPLPYRIEKQLQFVQIAVWDALMQLLQVLHRVPGVNGEGRIVVRDRNITKAAVRQYRSTHIMSISQPDAAYTNLNAIIAKGLAKDLTEVIKGDQKLVSINGTFGFFDPHMQFESNWGNDEQQTYRVKVGNGVTDGNGKSVDTPRIRKFNTDGFITSVFPPDLTDVSEFHYKVEIENDTLLVIGLLAAVFAGYVGATVAASFLTPFETGTPGARTTVDPLQIVLQTAASLLLLGGLFVLQQIANFEFEIWGVPFETVYEELRHDAILAQFSQISGGQPFREWERKDIEIKNYIFSTLADSPVPASGTEPAVTNPGLQTFAVRELAIQLAQQGSREVQMVRDILLEPADIIEDQDSGFRYFIKSITRELIRGESPSTQQATVFRVP